ncbi:phosphonate C-P lyase system protein PhnG [Nitratireductor alexandrii]|uniref:phosphonate C-P lyase system protein PhnG n=1 Tax=Nitratireductor alexandrii TaxID=2448161 RepID=UPI000FD80A7F|nr:phosphonate C-P lyase system protein PhnG [Nitratireductor alexandrii]
MTKQDRQDEAGRPARRDAMAVVARAGGDTLRRLWAEANFDEGAELVRGPEIGLVMLRGRMGGGGAAFNLGEATVTRATVRLATGEVGHAYALGRDRDKVRIAATVDALWQRPQSRAWVEDRIVAPLRDAGAVADSERRRETAATKVDFFTMVRGED